jgi:hypothetical protein
MNGPRRRTAFSVNGYRPVLLDLHCWLSHIHVFLLAIVAEAVEAIQCRGCLSSCETVMPGLLRNPCWPAFWVIVVPLKIEEEQSKRWSGAIAFLKGENYYTSLVKGCFAYLWLHVSRGQAMLAR